MTNILKKLENGYQQFREKYADGTNTMMYDLANRGQNPEVMVVACCDSRVDPAVILQCEPGDLFVVRNVANLIPPYALDTTHHGTCVALEFGLCNLGIEHLIILGHSQCGGIQAALEGLDSTQDDFISNWVADLKVEELTAGGLNLNAAARDNLLHSYENCLSFPFIKERLDEKKLMIHLWFFDIEKAQIVTYDFKTKSFSPL